MTHCDSLYVMAMSTAAAQDISSICNATVYCCRRRARAATARATLLELPR